MPDKFSQEIEATTEHVSMVDGQFSGVPVIDLDTDEVENIEDLLDKANSLHVSGKNSEDNGLPLRIIIPSVHMHFDNQTDNYWKYDQFVLKTGDESYHQHLQQGENLIEVGNDKWNLLNITNISSTILVGNKSFSDIKVSAKADKIFVSNVGRAFKINKRILDTENVFEIEPVDFDVVKVSPLNTEQGVRHHYQQLNRWLLFKI